MIILKVSLNTRITHVHKSNFARLFLPNFYITNITRHSMRQMIHKLTL